MSPISAARQQVQATFTVLLVLVGIATIIFRGSSTGHSSSAAYLTSIKQAAASYEHEKYVRLQLSETLSGSADTTLSIDERFNRVTKSSSAVVTAGGTSRRVISVGRTAFARVPSEQLTANHNKRWVAVTLQPTEAERELQGLSGPDYLSVLAGANGSVSNKGSETIDGAPTTRYDLHVDLKKLVGDTVRRILPYVTDTQLDGLGLDSVPITVWLDKQGQPRQVKLSYAVQGIKVTATALITPIKKPVAVRPPADRDINRVQTLLQWTTLQSGPTAFG